MIQQWEKKIFFYGEDIENLFYKSGVFLLSPINFQKNKNKKIIISDPITGKEPFIDLNQEEQNHIKRIEALFKTITTPVTSKEQLQSWKKLIKRIAIFSRQWGWSHIWWDFKLLWSWKQQFNGWKWRI